MSPDGSGTVQRTANDASAATAGLAFPDAAIGMMVHTIARSIVSGGGLRNPLLSSFGDRADLHEALGRFMDQVVLPRIAATRPGDHSFQVLAYPQAFQQEYPGVLRRYQNYFPTRLWVHEDGSASLDWEHAVLGKGGEKTVYFCLEIGGNQRLSVKACWDKNLSATGALPSSLPSAATSAAQGNQSEENLLGNPVIAELKLQERIYETGGQQVADPGKWFQHQGPRGPSVHVIQPLYEGSLDRALSDVKFNPKKKLSVAGDMIQQVRAMHAMEIAHLDIKPANFLMSGDSARLADFGSAIPLTGDDAFADSFLAANRSGRASAFSLRTPMMEQEFFASSTGNGLASRRSSVASQVQSPLGSSLLKTWATHGNRGTPFFTAPERRRVSRETDHLELMEYAKKSDVWSLGLTLYWLMASTPNHPATMGCNTGTASSMSHYLRLGQLTSQNHLCQVCGIFCGPGRRKITVPPPVRTVENLIFQMLNPDPDERPSMDEVQEKFRAMLGHDE